MLESSRAQVNGFILSIAAEEGLAVRPGMRILDFGCGSGTAVKFLVDRGFDAYGVDIEEYWNIGDCRIPQPKWEGEIRQRFRKIQPQPYRIPFEDNTFDFCCSDQVFEHVQNYHEALAEIHRVLKPAGGALHLFPARWRIIEGHVFVPFASVIRTRPYLAFWALLGIRNSFQMGKGWREVARSNEEYLKTKTNYLSRREIRKIAKASHVDIKFISRTYFMNHPSAKKRLIGMLPVPGLASLAGSFSTQAVYQKKITTLQ